MSSSAGLISGVEVSKVVRERVAAETAHIKAAEFSGHTAPRLDVIIVGGRKDSATYVRMKAKACEEVGFGHETHTLPETISQADLEAFVADLNANPSVNGILLQLPLPDHLHSPSVIERIAPTKDVDGLNPVNSGLLIRDGIAAPLVPCTPLGCVELLKHYKVPVAGKHAVVVGRSILVGKPIALLLQAMDATVTMCHSKTADLPAVIGAADIVVAALGRPLFVQGSWLKPGAVVIDVGINAVDDATKKSGHRLVGDVDFESAEKVASLITPVPGGVGPMTVAMLMENTVSAFYVQHARAVIAHVTAAAATDEAAVAAAVAAAAGADAGAWPVTAAALVALYGKGPLPQGLVKAVLHQLGLDANKKEDAELFVRKFRK